VQDHRGVGADIDEFRQVLLGLTYVNNPVGVIAKHPKELVNVQVNRGWLDARLAEWLDQDTTRFDCFLDGPVRENHIGQRYSAPCAVEDLQR
jgi:hypothetical protein